MLKIYRFFFSVLVIFVLSSCCHTNTVVKEVPPCVEDIEEYFHDCGQPTPITSGITYEELVDAMRKDRNSLQLCILENKKISSTLKECDIQIKKFNKEVNDLKKNN